MPEPGRTGPDVARPNSDERALAPAVGKSLELGLVTLFVGLMVTVLLGGVVPDYRAATGAELGDRVLATATQEVEQSIPPTAREVSVTRRVALPATIVDSGYSIRADGESLVLDHPHPDVGGRMRLALPASVRRVEGRWQSGGRTVVHVHEGGGDLIVELRTEP